MKRAMILDTGGRQAHSALILLVAWTDAVSIGGMPSGYFEAGATPGQRGCE
jgi:hypothetical protein